MSATEEKKFCHFFKLIKPSILQDKKLQIPKKFVKKFGDLSGVATLTVPDVGMWPVTLLKIDRTLWFDNGWNEFIERCSIHAGHFLDFRYEGDSNFSVNIYDLVPYKINNELNSTRTTEDCGKQSRVHTELEHGDSIEILDAFSTPRPAVKSLKRKHHDELNDDCVQILGSSPAPELQELVKTKCGKRLKATDCTPQKLEDTRREKHKDGNELVPHCEEEFKIITGEDFSRLQETMSLESKRAVEAAKMCKLKNPSFMVILPQLSLPCNNMLVPAAFAERHLHGTSDSQD